jgi:hypothetical protein
MNTFLGGLRAVARISIRDPSAGLASQVRLNEKTRHVKGLGGCESRPGFPRQVTARLGSELTIFQNHRPLLSAHHDRISDHRTP